MVPHFNAGLLAALHYKSTYSCTGSIALPNLVVQNDVLYVEMWVGDGIAMNARQDFLRFEVVLSHCEKRVPEGSPGAAMEYGRTMDYFDGYNSLSQSGRLLAEMLMPTTSN